MTALLVAQPTAVYRPPVRTDDLPCLPPGFDRVADLPGVLSIALCRPTSEPQVVRHLLAAGVPYYFPRERVVRKDDKGRSRGAYFKSRMPGYLIVGDGLGGRQAAADYGRRFAGTVSGFLGFPGSETPGLRRDLTRVEQAIALDATAECIAGFRKGMSVTVRRRGQWYGLDGVVDSLDPRDCALHVNIPFLGSHYRLAVLSSELEPADRPA